MGGRLTMVSIAVTGASGSVGGQVVQLLCRADRA